MHHHVRRRPVVLGEHHGVHRGPGQPREPVLRRPLRGCRMAGAAGRNDPARGPRGRPAAPGSPMTDGGAPAYELALTHFIVSDDVERSRRFYTEVLGGTAIRSGEPTYVALANSWIIINAGGGPTDDKPAVTLETPRDTGSSSSFLNTRVSDIDAVYA